MSITFSRKSLSCLLTLFVAIIYVDSPGLADDRISLPSELALPPEGIHPPKGFVPTEDVAKAVAEAVLIPIYGRDNIIKQRPYEVRLEAGDVWVVEGLLHQPLSGTRLGGVFTIKISRETGEILYVMHTR